MHEGLNPRSRHEPQDFHKEPRGIGYVTQLVECPLVGWSVRHSRSLVTYSLSFLLSDTAECLSLMVECPLNYKGAQLGNPRALIPYQSVRHSWWSV